MEEQTPVGFQYAPGVLQAWLEKSQIVVEHVRISLRSELDGPVTLPLKARSVPVLIPNGGNPCAGLNLAGVEWGIDVYQIDRLARQVFENAQIVTIVDRNLSHCLASCLTPELASCVGQSLHQTPFARMSIILRLMEFATAEPTFFLPR